MVVASVAVSVVVGDVGAVDEGDWLAASSADVPSSPQAANRGTPTPRVAALVSARLLLRGAVMSTGYDQYLRRGYDFAVDFRAGFAVVFAGAWARTRPLGWAAARPASIGFRNWPV